MSKMIALLLLLVVGALGWPTGVPYKPPAINGPPMDNKIGETPFTRFPNVVRNGTQKENEDDLKLTDEQHDMLFSTDAEGRSKRKAWKGAKFRWTNNVVPYHFKGNDYTADQKREIREAMDVFEKETCLKFRPATSSDVNKIRFQQGQGCNSQLGMVGGDQELNLDVNGCRWKGLYWHEINHALGLVHEHQLPGRNVHIKINWNNVNPAFYSAFSTYKDSELDRFGIPYDLTSIMHYEVKSFSQTGGQTIVPRDKSMEPWIGNVWISQMSFTDVMILNRMYQCADKCTQKSCEGGFINKECKCVTPKSYFKEHCINEHHDEDECYERAHKGDCDRDYGFMNFKCRKACDRCAMFGMDELRKGKDGGCYNQYFDDAKCDAWAKAGDCDKYPSWMKRQCKKSCGTCDSKWGKCLNMEFDSSCDDFAKRGECESNPEWMKNKCPDSCDTCGYITRGKCENEHPNEDECFEWSRAGQCVDDDLTRAFWMRKNCAASCNSCGFGKGECENDKDDFECDKLAYEGGCNSNPTEVRKNCKKSCNTCDYGVRGDCEDKFEVMFKDDNACSYWAAQGSCDFNYGWYSIFCAAACNVCDKGKEWKESCRDLKTEDECRRWKESGECDANGGFNRYNCAKTCKSCHVLTDELVCVDVQGATNCEFWKNKNQCVDNEHWMTQNCRLTCGKCEAGERQIPDEPWPECENINSDTACDNWATSGECQNNAKWMARNCHKSCNSKKCGYKDVELSDPCQNKHENCEMWAETGQCGKGDYMVKNCYKACNPSECGGDSGTVDKPSGGECKDNDDSCDEWARGDGCERGKEYMHLNCRKACKLCGGDNSGGNNDNKPQNGECKNDHESCEVWAKGDGCAKGAGYMDIHCRKACGLCSGNTSGGPDTPANVNCVDDEKDCPEWKDWGHCDINPTVKRVCPKSCGVC